MSIPNFSNLYQAIRSALYNVANILYGDLSASDNAFIFVVPYDMPQGVKGVTIDDVIIVTETTITAHDANFWSFQIADLTNSTNLLAAAKTTKATGGTAITGDTAYRITPDQNNTTLGAGTVIEFQATKASSATTAEALAVIVRWHWEVI